MADFARELPFAPAQTPTPPVALIPVPPVAAIVLVAVFVVVILVVALFPVVSDLRHAHRWRAEMTRWVQSGAVRQEDLIPVLRLIARPRRATTTTRATIAYLVVALVAAALGAVIFSDAADAVDLRKTVITAVLTVLSSVIGFYFGSRTAQTAIEAQQAPPDPTPDR
jgi:hypothetical protein